MLNITRNKKVLLRERKRHTARRVASTPYVVLTGYPPHPDLARRGGTLLGGTDLGTPGRVPPPGYPPARVPHPDRVPPHQGTPPAGYSPPRAGPGRVPPPWLPHGILGNVAKHYGIWVLPPVAAPWHSGKCCKALWDMSTLPPGVDKLTK